MARISLGLGAATAISALLAAPTGSSSVQASRIIDRTLVCPMSGVGYPDPVRVLEIQARPRLGDRSPEAAVYHLPDVHASARTGPHGDQGTGAVVLKGCAASTLRLRLSRRGLKGGPTALGERQRCEVPARILVRLRAVFSRPVILRRERGYVIATGKIATAYLGVATLPNRKPLAFASITDAPGNARIFAASSACREEK
jgi:hypothetical protein